MLQPLTGLAPRVSPGYRAISLQTTDEIAVGGLLKPGDKVDVQLVLRGETLAAPGVSSATASGEARTLLESILVLAVGTQMTAKTDGGETATPARTVTLALRPDQLSAFTLARSLGAIYLALRNPADAALPGPARAMLRDIRPGETPPPTRIAYRHAATATPRRAVEIVIGGERRTVSAQETIR